MNIFHLFFGFGGRLNRAKYWLVTVVWIAIWVVALVAALVILGANWPDSDLPADEKRSAYLDILLDYAAIFVPLFVIGWISALAVGIRRLHDRNKSGWWIVLFYFGPAVIEIFRLGTDLPGASPVLGLASAIISIWMLVELGFLRGTHGPNHYGADPLQRGAVAATA